MIRERGSLLAHILDRYVGIPAVGALGIVQRRRVLPTRIERVGVLKTGGIGDLVLATGVIADLRKSFPKSLLVLFCSQNNSGLANMIEGVDQVVNVPLGDFFAGCRAVRSVPLDLLLDLGHWTRVEALLTRFSRAQFTVGFRTKGQYRHYGYDLAVEHSQEVHELENYRRLVRSIGICTGNLPKLRAGWTIPREVRQYVVFHPWPAGINSFLKEWPQERWLRLVKDLVHWGSEVVFTGGHSDRERNNGLIARVPPDMRGSVRNAAGSSLEETCALLTNATLIVSVNTGVMHLAAALGVPLVALHGPTSSKRWGPVSGNAIVIDSPLPGCAYLNLGWEYPAKPPKCMEAISYESVRDACQAILEAKVLPIRSQTSQ